MTPIEQWTPEQVQDWLQRSGFTDLVDTFVKHQIDGEVLLSLTESDLSRPPFNMQIFGRMRKLSLAIGRLKEVNSAGEFFDQNQDDIVDPEENVELNAAAPAPSIENRSVLTLTVEKCGLIDEIIQTDEQQRTMMIQEKEETSVIVDYEPQQSNTSNQCSASIQMNEKVTIDREVRNVIDNVIDDQILPEDHFTNEFSQNLILQGPSGSSPLSDAPPPEPTLTDPACHMELLYPHACWRYPGSQDHLLSAVNFDTAQTADDKKQQKNCGFKAEVSYFVSPVEIYVQPDFLQDTIDDLVDQMTEYYEKSDDMQSISFDDFYEGMPCAVKFREDNRWYRAKVAERGIEDCRVIFIDWGNSQFESYAGVRPLLAKFGLYPPLTFRCRIAGVRERTLVQKVVDNFKHDIETVLDKIVYCIPRKFENGVLTISLINLATDEDLGKKYLPTEAVCPLCPTFLPPSSVYGGDDSGVGGIDPDQEDNALLLNSGGDSGDLSQQSYAKPEEPTDADADPDVEILSDDEDDDAVPAPMAVIRAPVFVPQPYPMVSRTVQQQVSRTVPQSVSRTVPQTVCREREPLLREQQQLFTVIVRPCSKERLDVEPDPSELLRSVPHPPATSSSSSEFRPRSAEPSSGSVPPQKSAIADNPFVGAFERAFEAHQKQMEEYRLRAEKMDPDEYFSEIDTDTDEDAPCKQIKEKAGFKQTTRKVKNLKQQKPYF